MAGKYFVRFSKRYTESVWAGWTATPHTLTLSTFPRIFTSAKSVKANSERRAPNASYVAPLMRMLWCGYSLFNASIRDARFTLSPMTVYSCRGGGLTGLRFSGRAWGLTAVPPPGACERDRFPDGRVCLH